MLILVCYMQVFCIFVCAPVQRSWACFTWKGAVEIRSLLLVLLLLLCSCHQWLTGVGKLIFVDCVCFLVFASPQTVSFCLGMVKMAGFICNGLQNMFYKDAPFTKLQEKTCGLSALPWRPNSTATNRSWRRRHHSSPERPWSCRLRTPRRRRYAMVYLDCCWDIRLPRKQT